MTEIRRLQDAQVEDVLHALNDSPIVAEVMASRAAERTARRQILVDALSAATANAETDWHANSAAMDIAAAAVKSAEQALRDRVAEFNAALFARGNASRTFTLRRDEIEAELRELAAIEIAGFLREMRDALYATMKTKIPDQAGGERPNRNVITGKRIPAIRRAFGNSITARMEAIRAAIKKAEALQFLPDQSGVPEMLAELRAGLPKIEFTIGAANDGAEAAPV